MLPGAGRRLGRYPRVASVLLVGLRRVPSKRVRALLYRNVSRPLAERMDARLVVPVSGGSRMIVDTSDMMGRVLATSGIWEPHVTVVLPRLLAAGDVFVDVGAHVGYHTLLAAKLVGPSGRVYALEPSTSTYAALRANLELNQTTNVRALRVAAGMSETHAELVEPPAGNTGEAAIRTGTASEGSESALAANEVVVKPLVSVLDEADLPRLRLVKIDVEGFEAEVLRGVEPLLANGVRFAMIAEIHPHRVAETVTAVERLQSAFSLRAYELVRVPHGDRFAAVPPPRVIVDLDEVERSCNGRTVNVLLLPSSSTDSIGDWSGGL